MLYYQTNDIKLYLQDNLELLQTLPNNSLDLIYCDILFNSNQKFDDYDDNLGEPMDAVKWYNPRIKEMYRILKPSGSIYIHCDWHLNSYMRVLLDKIFGWKQYKNEIVRQCTNAKNNSNNWGKIYDNILYYTKGDKYTFNAPTEPKIEVDLVNQYNKVDSNGEYYTTIPLHGKGETKLGETGQPWNSKSHGIINLPKGRHWAISHSELEKLDKLGQIEWSKNGNPRKILYAKDYQDRPIQNIWNLKSLGVSPNKVQQYSTQKPIELLDRIIKTSSNEGDLIGDFFLGGGTTAVVCKMNGRKFIGCDIQTKALELTKSKLESLQ